MQYPLELSPAKHARYRSYSLRPSQWAAEQQPKNWGVATRMGFATRPEHKSTSIATPTVVMLGLLAAPPICLRRNVIVIIEKRRKASFKRDSVFPTLHSNIATVLCYGRETGKKVYF